MVTSFLDSSSPALSYLHPREAVHSFPRAPRQHPSPLTHHHTSSLLIYWLLNKTLWGPKQWLLIFVFSVFGKIYVLNEWALTRADSDVWVGNGINQQILRLIQSNLPDYTDFRWMHTCAPRNTPTPTHINTHPDGDFRSVKISFQFKNAPSGCHS